MNADHFIHNYVDRLNNEFMVISNNDFNKELIINSIDSFVKKDIKILRLFRINKFINFFYEKGLIPKTKIHYFFSFSKKAYMKDSGDLFLSIPFILSSNSANFIITLIHELSHLYLSNHNDYKKLLLIDKMFFEVYGKNNDTLLVSPVEYYADAIMINTLNKVCENSEDNKKKMLIMKTLKIKTDYLQNIVNNWILNR